MTTFKVTEKPTSTTKCTAHVGNIMTSITGDIPVEFWEDLSLRMSYEVPGAFFSPAAQSGHWDGRKKLFNKRWLAFPTGLFSLFRDACADHGIAYEVNDTRKIPVFGERISIKGITLRDYQLDAADKALKKQRGMVRAATGSGKCITGDSLLFTEKGIVTMNQLQKSMNCAEGEAKPLRLSLSSKDGMVTTSHFYNDGVRDTKRIATRIGYEVEGTYEHPLLVLNNEGALEFKKIKDISLGETVCIQRDQEVWGKSVSTSDFVFKASAHQLDHRIPSVDESLGRILGYMVAEGHFSDSNCNFTNTNEEVISDFLCCFEKCFGYVPKKKDAISFDLNTDKIRQYLKYCGLTPVNSSKKEIPHRILTAPRNVVVSFLQAYFEGDGGVEREGFSGIVSCTSASEALTKQLQVVLLNLGIISNRRSSYKAATNGTRIKRKYWTLSITSDTRLFEERIGFISSEKRAKLAATAGKKANTNVDVIPIKHLFSEIKSKELAFTCTKKSQPSYDALARFLNYSFFCSPKTSKKSLSRFSKWENLEKANRLLKAHFFFDKVTKITNTSSVVYDFCVPIFHNFTSNGFISHNTEIISELIGRTNLPTLVLIHKQDIFHQLYERLSKRLGVPIGRIGCGIIDPQRITVGMIQTIHRAYGGTLQGLKDIDKDETKISKPEIIQGVVESAECVIIDECHHVAASIFGTVLTHCEKAYYRWGFSASPFREDNADLLLDAHTGARCVDISASELIKKGYLAKPTIYLYEFDHGRPNAFGYPHMYEQQVVNNTFRNKAVVRAVLKAMAADKTCLVAVTRIDHGRILEAMLQQVAPGKIKFASGQIDSAERKQILQDLNDRKLNVVIATTVFGEGIDCPTLDVLVNAKANKSSIDSLQLVGRALRKTATKSKVFVVDIYDDHCKYLGTHAKDRLKIYKTEPEFTIKKIKEPDALIF